MVAFWSYGAVWRFDVISGLRSLHEGDGVPYKLHGGYLILLLWLIVIVVVQVISDLTWITLWNCCWPHRSSLREALSQWFTDLGQPLPCTSDSYVHISVFPFLFFAVLETDIRAALCFTHVAVSSNLVSFLLYLFLSSYEGSPLICIYLHPELFNFSAGVGSLYVFSPGGIVTLLMYVLRSFFAMFRRWDERVSCLPFRLIRIAEAPWFVREFVFDRLCATATATAQRSCRSLQNPMTAVYQILRCNYARWQWHCTRVSIDRPGNRARSLPS